VKVKKKKTNKERDRVSVCLYIRYTQYVQTTEEERRKEREKSFLQKRVREGR